MIKKLLFSVLCLSLWFTSFFNFKVYALYSSPPEFDNSLTVTVNNGTKLDLTFPDTILLNTDNSFLNLSSLDIEQLFFDGYRVDKEFNVLFMVRLKVYDNQGNVFIPTKAASRGRINSASYINLTTNNDFSIDDDGYINVIFNDGDFSSNLSGVSLDLDFSNSFPSYDNYQLFLDVDYFISVGGTVGDFFSYVNYYFLFKGSSDSSSSSSALDNANENLGNSINDYDEIENGQVEDFNTNIGNLNTDLGILNLSDFTTTAMWLSNQMTRIVTSNNVIQYMITFSLIIGFALVLIGRGLR